MHDVAWRGMWICVRSNDAQKQLARTSLNLKLNAALCLQKLALTGDNAVPVPDNIQAYVNNSLEWDNIDRL